jgi:hypothetical protein
MPKAAGKNPLEVIQDPRVVSTAAGALTAQIARKALFESSREQFGIAANLKDKGIVYLAPTKNSSGNIVGDVNKEIAGAYTSRLLTHLGFVVAGTLLIGSGVGGLDDSKNDEELNLAYFGLGFAGSGFANFVAAIIKIDL